MQQSFGTVFLELWEQGGCVHLSLETRDEEEAQAPYSKLGWDWSPSGGLTQLVFLDWADMPAGWSDCC